MNEMTFTAGNLTFKMNTSFNELCVSEVPELMVKNIDAPEDAWKSVKLIYVEDCVRGYDWADIIAIGENEELLGHASGVSRKLANKIKTVMNAAHALRKHVKQLISAYEGREDAEICVAEEKTGEKCVLATLDNEGEPMRICNKVKMTIENASRAGSPVLVDDETGKAKPVEGVYLGYGSESLPVVYGQNDTRFVIADGDMTSTELIRKAWEPNIAVTRDAATLMKHVGALEALV